MYLSEKFSLVTLLNLRSILLCLILFGHSSYAKSKQTIVIQNFIDYWYLDWRY